MRTVLFKYLVCDSRKIISPLTPVLRTEARSEKHFAHSPKPHEQKFPAGTLSTILSKAAQNLLAACPSTIPSKAAQNLLAASPSAIPSKALQKLPEGQIFTHPNHMNKNSLQLVLQQSPAKRRKSFLQGDF